MGLTNISPPLLLTTTLGQEGDPLAIDSPDGALQVQPPLQEGGEFSARAAEGVAVPEEAADPHDPVRVGPDGFEVQAPLSLTDARWIPDPRSPRPSPLLVNPAGRKPVAPIAIFNPQALRCDPGSGRLTYDDGRPGQLVSEVTDLSHDVVGFDGLMDFLDQFAPTEGVTRQLQILEHRCMTRLAPPGLVALLENVIAPAVGALLGIDLGSLQFSQSGDGGGASLVDDRGRPLGSDPGITRIDLRRGVYLTTSLQDHHLVVEWHGILPNDQVWRLEYDADGELCYVQGQMHHIDPEVFACAWAPESLRIAEPVMEVLDGLQVPVRVLAAKDGAMRDLARGLELVGQPCTHAGPSPELGYNPPHLHQDGMSEYHDAEQAQRAQQAKAAEEEHSQEIGQLMQRYREAIGRLLQQGPSAMLDILKTTRELAKFPLLRPDTQAPLPNGTRLLVQGFLQRLEIDTAGGRASRPTSLYETITQLNTLMAATVGVCYTVEPAPGEGYVVQVFVYHPTDREWQYLTRLDFDRLGMRWLSVPEAEAGIALQAEAHDHAVNQRGLEDAWGPRGSNLSASDEALLRRARIILPTADMTDDAAQTDYANTVAEFLALVMNDETGLIHGLNGKDIFDGVADLGLEWVGFTYSNDIHTLVQQYVAYRIADDPHDRIALTPEERARLAERFRFTSQTPDGAFFSRDDRLREWFEAMNRRAAYGHLKLMHQALGNQDGMFSVLLDLRPGRPDLAGPPPPPRQRRQTSCPARPQEDGIGIFSRGVLT